MTDRVREKGRRVEGVSELHIEQDRDRDERAREIKGAVSARAREREVERERFVARAIPEQFSPVCLG